MNYWKEYNEDLKTLYKSILKHNTNNIFNFVEKNHYNHIRDLLALTIANATSETNNKLTILDYGSNLMTWVNLKNKIKTSSLSVKIFDPFSDYIEIGKEQLGFDIEIINDTKLLKKYKFDISVFGSCSQYIKNFYEELESIESLLNKTIVFTHTPLSKHKSFITNQTNAFQGIQYIRSFNELNNFISSKGYSLIFKSTLPPESAYVKKSDESKIVYANLIFRKI